MTSKSRQCTTLHTGIRVYIGPCTVHSVQYNTENRNCERRSNIFIVKTEYCSFHFPDWPVSRVVLFLFISFKYHILYLQPACLPVCLSVRVTEQCYLVTLFLLSVTCSFLAWLTDCLFTCLFLCVLLSWEWLHIMSSTTLPKRKEKMRKDIPNNHIENFELLIYWNQ